MVDAPLRKAIPLPISWSIECPCCEMPADIDLFEQPSGVWAPDGPDQFPLCEHCGEQFEVASLEWREASNG